MIRQILVSLLLLLLGCVNTSHNNAPAQIQVNISSAPAFHLSDAVDIAKLDTKDGEVQLSTKLQLSRGGTIYFGEINTYDEDDQADSSIPLIARLHDGHWKTLRIDDKRLHDAAWSYVAAGPHRGEIW